MRMALAMPSLMPRERRSVLVTKRSSPTSWIFFLEDFVPTQLVSVFQPTQSSSAMPSSMETMGYFSTQFVQYAAIWSDECSLLSDFLKTYLPADLSKNSLEAGSSAVETCWPGL